MRAGSTTGRLTKSFRAAIPAREMPAFHGELGLASHLLTNAASHDDRRFRRTNLRSRRFRRTRLRHVVRFAEPPLIGLYRGTHGNNLAAVMWADI